MAKATKTRAASPADLATLVKKVDELGRIKDELAEISSCERAAAAALKEAMQAAGLDNIQGRHFVAQLAEQTTLKLDAEEFWRMAGRKQFMECARVDLKAARKHFGDAELEAVGETVLSRQLRVSRRPGVAAAAPIRRRRTG
jgi:hypothetical protein